MQNQFLHFSDSGNAVISTEMKDPVGTLSFLIILAVW